MFLSRALSRARRRPGVLAGPGRTGGRRPGPVGRPPRRGRCRLGRPAAATPLRSLVGDEPHGWRAPGWTTRAGDHGVGPGPPRAASGRPAGPSHSPARFALKRGRPLYDQPRPGRAPVGRTGRTRGALQGGPSPPPGVQIPKATCSGAVHAPRPRRCGFGRPRHPVAGGGPSARIAPAVDPPGGRPPGGRRCHSMTAPAHRVGDLRDRPPAPGPAPMVDPPVVADLARSLDPRRTRRGDSIESNPPRPPLAHGAAGRGVERAGPHPGAPLVSKGPTWRVDGPGSWSRPRALAAGRCRRLPLLHGPGCSAGSARRPRPHNLLGAERGAAPGPRSSRACPESIRLIAPVDGLVPLLSRPQSASVLPSGLTQTIEHAPFCRAWIPGPPDPGPARSPRCGRRRCSPRRCRV